MDATFEAGVRGDLGDGMEATDSIRPEEGTDAGRGDVRRFQLTLRTPAETVPASARLVEVGLRFGVPLETPQHLIAADLTFSVSPGSVVLVNGPSGSGKSLLLNELARQWPTSRFVSRVVFPQDVSVLDAVAPVRPLCEALGILTACGVGEPTLWIRRFEQLSEGEQFRVRLARAIGLQRREGKHGALLCDEFGGSLHRRLTEAVAFNLRKLATRERITIIVATPNEDIARDLQPDVRIRLDCQPHVEQRDDTSTLRPSGFLQRMVIERGSMRDYEQFASMHYRRQDHIGYVDKVFVCRDGQAGPLMGVVVYGFPALELALRNQVTSRRFSRQPKRLNRELRTLKRLVVHPDVRGCGIGHRLVRHTLPMVGTTYVECLAAMGAVNPVFVKAGMVMIGVCETPAMQSEAVAELRSIGADPVAADFVDQVRRRPVVRRLVAECVRRWYLGMTGETEARMIRQSPTALAHTYRQLAGSAPVYYLWTRDRSLREQLRNRSISC